MMHMMTDGKGSSFRAAGSPLNFNGAPLELSSRAPDLDEHTEEILRKWLGKE